MGLKTSHTLPSSFLFPIIWARLSIGSINQENENKNPKRGPERSNKKKYCTTPWQHSKMKFSVVIFKPTLFSWPTLRSVQEMAKVIKILNSVDIDFMTRARRYREQVKIWII